MITCYGHAALLAARCANGCTGLAAFLDSRQRQVCGLCATNEETKGGTPNVHH